MIDVSPFIQVTDFADERLTVTAYKNLAIFEVGFSFDNDRNRRSDEPVYALIRSVNKNIEYYNEIYFSQQAYSTHGYVVFQTFVGVFFDEEYGYVLYNLYNMSYYSEYVSLDAPLDFASAVNYGYVDSNWNPWNSVFTDNNGVVWRGGWFHNRTSAGAFWHDDLFFNDLFFSEYFSKYDIRPSAKALGEIVTFKRKRSGQEIDVGPIYFHHYEQDASDKKRVRVFGWTDFPEGYPHLVQEIRFD